MRDLAMPDHPRNDTPELPIDPGADAFSGMVRNDKGPKSQRTTSAREGPHPMITSLLVVTALLHWRSLVRCARHALDTDQIN